MTVPAEDEATARMRARERVMAVRAADIRRARLDREERQMPHDPNRPQSGYFDAHPAREAYMPAHVVCEPAQSPRTTEPDQEPTEPENGPQTGA